MRPQTFLTLLLTTAVLALGSVSEEAEARSADEGEMSTMRIIDFTLERTPWRNIDDMVMGGVSSSRMVIEGGVAVFSGTVSLANNGGFASVRSLPAEYDIGAFDGLVLRLRGDGKRYAVRVRTTDSFDGVSYQAMIQPPAGQWQDIVVPFDRFEAVYRGRRVGDYPALDPAAIRTFGVLISDKQEGPFRLELAWIAAVGKPTEGAGDDP